MRVKPPSAQVVLLKDIFLSGFFREDDERPGPTNGRHAGAADVHRELTGVDISKGAGREAIQPHVPRWIADCLPEPWSILFANSLSAVVVPLDWCYAITCPIHENGDPDDASNRHPVSLTFIIFDMIFFCFLIETRTLMGLSGNPIHTCQLVDDLRLQAENIFSPSMVPYDGYS